MRITSRQTGIERSLPPHRGGWPLASGRRASIGLARMMIGLALSALLAHPVAGEEKGGADKPVIPSWYTQTFTRSDSGMNVSYLWSLKSKLRSETVVGGHNIVTIVNGDTYYAYDMLRMLGIAIRRAPAALAAESPDRRPFGNEAEIVIDQGGEKIREERIGGKTADVYQVTDDIGRRIVWTTQDDRRLTLRVEIFHRNSGSTRNKEHLDWVNGFPVTDAFFEPDPRIEFERFELDEFIENTNAKGSATKIPILYQDLLHGPAQH